ncbi:MAG: hypothetical protein MJD61_17050 [Proteobacteria bacterium]|nr:hypothetical protein [Pseudomonadota bacterium]
MGITVATWCCLVGPPQASAQPGPILDLHRGPLQTSSRVTGMGGAYTSVAEGVDGYYRNPASIANRSYDQTTWFHPSLSLDLMLTPIGNVDYDNDGVVVGDSSELRSYLAGLRLAFGGLALGPVFLARTQTVSVDNGNAVSATDRELGASAGVSLGRGTIVFGAGAGIRTLNLKHGRAGTPIAVQMGRLALPQEGIDYNAMFIDLGVLYRPVTHNWRLGGRFRLPSSAEPSLASVGFPSVYGVTQPAPGEVKFPWEAGIGISYEVTSAGRARNAPIGDWDEGVRRRVRDSRYLLFSFDLMMAGPSSDAINLESYLAGSGPMPPGYRRSGEALSFGLHAGVEAEMIPDRLRVRGGSYTDPDRTTGSVVGRYHLTGGADLRIIDIWVFRIKIGVAADIAPRYSNVQIGAGLW